MGALLLRVALIATPGFEGDRLVFMSWSQVLATHGPLAIYGPGVVPPVDYPPGYLYVLWLVGLTHAAFDGGAMSWRIVLKVVPILADLVVMATLYAIVRRTRDERRALATTALAGFAPPLWLDSAVWGQADSVPLALVCVGLFVALAGQFAFTWPLLAASIFIKPQGVVIAPALAVLQARVGLRSRDVLAALGASLAIAYCGTLAFSADRSPFPVFGFLFDRYRSGVLKAPHTTEGAFNLYALISNFYASDALRFGPLNYRTLGIVLVVALVAATTVVLARALARRVDESRRTSLLLGATSMALLALFLFATRMHERYLLPGLILGAPLVFEDRRTALAYGWLALAFVVNCAFILAGFTGGAHHPVTVLVGRACAAGNLIAFGILWQRQWQRAAAV